MVVYILIQVEKGEAWKIAGEVAKMNGVIRAHPVTGLYDVIAYAELEDLEYLKNLIERVQGIKGIERTHTAVSI